MYDLIGDIHGFADELVALLKKLGYERRGGAYRHAERQVIFVGDFVDRGPKIRQVLEIARAMVDGGAALAVMGNHEFNALAYHTPDANSPGEYLRRHKPNNVLQHRQTVEQLSEAEMADYLTWFRTLPMWLDLDGLCVVHACWDEASIDQVRRMKEPPGGMSDAFLQAAARPGNPLYAAVEVLLKGKETRLPPGISFEDKEGHIRHDTRVRWYLPATGHTYRTYAFSSEELDCDLPLEQSVIDGASPYPADAKPVFIGHYWLQPLRPKLLANNVACLDYSVAKGGFLCAYRWDGEQQLSSENFVWA